VTLGKLAGLRKARPSLYPRECRRRTVRLVPLEAQDDKALAIAGKDRHRLQHLFFRARVEVMEAAYDRVPVRVVTSTSVPRHGLW
jgi:hypothetical protein